MTMRWKGSERRDLVAVDQVDVGPEALPQQRDLRRVVLRVAVGVEHVLLGRRLEAAAQRPAVAAVLRVVDDAHLRVHPRQFVEDLRRAVLAAVVDDDDLVVGRERTCRQQRRHHHARDGAAVVVGREEDAQAGRRSGRSFWHTRTGNLSTDLSRGARATTGVAPRAARARRRTPGSRRATSSTAPRGARHR